MIDAFAKKRRPHLCRIFGKSSFAIQIWSDENTRAEECEKRLGLLKTATKLQAQVSKYNNDLSETFEKMEKEGDVPRERYQLAFDSINNTSSISEEVRE